MSIRSKASFTLALLLCASLAHADGIINGGGSGGGSPTGAAGGDLSGTYPNPTYTGKVNGALGQTPGTATNDNATAGKVGEESDTTAAATTVSLTTTVPANVVSISLTAGDWEVSGNCTFAGGATTVIVYAQCGLTTTTGVIIGDPFSTTQVLNVTPFGTATRVNQIPPSQRFSLSATTTIFLVTTASFNTSTLTGGGLIHARRVR